MQQGSKQKNIDSLGWLFLISVVVYVVITILVDILSMSFDVELPTEFLLVFSEIIILVPTVIFIIVKKLKWKEDLGFNSIKVGTIFLSILLGFLVLPVTMFVNVLSQFFVPNTMTQASDALLGEGMSYGYLLFVSGVFGPFVEEFSFRGVLARGFKKYGTPIRAMLLSALLFGFMHLNVNQMCYAFVLGIIFVIANRASGSTYTSVIMHVVINSFNMILLIVTNLVNNMMGNEETVAEAAEAARTSDTLIVIAIVYGVLAVIFGALSFGCILLIARVQNRMNELKGMFIKSKTDIDEANVSEQEDDATVEKEEKVKMFLSVPIIIAIVFCIVVIFGLEPLLEMFS